MKTGNLEKRPVRVGMVSLGCAKNLIDAEIMLGSLVHDGFELTHDPAQADVVVINTCSFIESAQQESVDAILEFAARRNAQHPRQALVVAGCLPQRFGRELPQLLPEVDGFMGLDQVTDVPQIIRQALAQRQETAARRGPSQPKPAAPRTTAAPVATAKPPPAILSPRSVFLPSHDLPRVRLTPRHFAYLKIAEGCNHPCSYCVIPRIRGRYRSRPPADLVAEARQLVRDGVKELNLISQDTTFYGRDLARSPGADAATAPRLSALLRSLNAVRGDFWIRLLYTHPAHWTDELIQTMAECRKVARYVDLPLQHIHPLMLERMRRETTEAQLRDLIARLRAGLRGVTLRTTFIVGFPGETEACFERLLGFLREVRFERVGVFTFSPETGTRAAQMANPVPETVKQARRNQAMATQLAISRQVTATQVGRNLRVLVEKPADAAELRQAQVSSWEHGLVRARNRKPSPLEGEYLVARGEADAPDIDGRVYIRGPVAVGSFAQVRVVGNTDYDLIAEPEVT